MEDVKINQVYRHFKGGLYRVIALGKDSASLEEVVIYQSLIDHQVWVRPLSEWVEHVDSILYTGPRFMLVPSD